MPYPIQTDNFQATFPEIFFSRNINTTKDSGNDKVPPCFRLGVLKFWGVMGFFYRSVLQAVKQLSLSRSIYASLLSLAKIMRARFSVFHEVPSNSDR